MAVKKEFESFGESTKTPEIFSFPESENQKGLLSEDFVFKFEDNETQTGLDANDPSLGNEDNKKEAMSDEDLDKIKDAAQAEEGASEASSSSASSSSASSSSAASTAAGSVSSTVAAAAATTTAAVVLVVGGGVVMGQTLEKPNICNFDEIGVVENSINFKLSLGTDQERIDNGEEDTECDITIDLLCPDMEDFEKHIEVKQFGAVVGEFTDLEYDTEYLLNVSQHVMMSADYEYLLEKPISVRTEAKAPDPEPEPEPEPEVAPISLYANQDPMGGTYWYIEVSNKVDIPAYDEYYVFLSISERGIHYEDGTDPEETEEPIASADYDVTQMGRQPIYIDSEYTGARSYFAALVGVNEDDQEIQEEIITSTTISQGDIITSDIDLTQPHAFFMRDVVYTDGIPEYTYYAYINYPETVDPDAKFQGYLSDSFQSPDPMPFVVEELNTKTPVDLMFDEYQLSHYATYTVSINTIDYSTQQEVELFSESINFNYIPTTTTENPETNNINIYEEVDPMGGKYYYAEVKLVTELPSYSSYGVYMKAYNTSPSGDDWTVASAYDVNEMGKQPLYVSGTLEAPTYDVAFVGIEEVAGEQTVTGIFSQTMTPSDFISSYADTSYNRIFFTREYDLTRETEHIYAYANVVDDTSEMIRFMGSMTPTTTSDSSMTFSLDVVNQKTEVDINFSEYGWEDYWSYNVTISGGGATGGTTTLISETVDFGLVPYSTYTSTPNGITIYEEIDPVGGYRYYAEVEYYDTWPDDPDTTYYVYMKDADNLDQEWTVISEYDINSMGVQRLSSALEQLTAEEYYVAFVGIDSNENEAYLFQTFVFAEDFLVHESSDDNGLYLLREINLNTYDNAYYGYLQYDGDTSNLSEISGFLVDVEDQTGSVAAYITMYSFNNIELVDFTWGNASEYATYYVTVQAMDRSDPNNPQNITILDQVVINFDELPTRSVGEANFIGATFSRALSASGRNEYGLIDMNYQDPFNAWSDFQITMTDIYEQTSETYDIVEVSSALNYYYGTSLYYIQNCPVTQSEFTYQISAIVNDDSHTDERMTIYDSTDEDPEVTGNLFNGEMNIDGSCNFYVDYSQTVEDNVLYIRPVFDRNDPTYEFDSMKIIITYVEDNDETYTVNVDLTDLENPIETNIPHSSIAGKIYEVRTIGYTSSGEEILIFVEEVELAGA